MYEVLPAVYEKGNLKLLEPLKVAEHKKIWIQVLPDSPNQEIDDKISALVRQGILIPPTQSHETRPRSLAERRQLALKIGRKLKTPVSQQIIADRGDRW